MCFICLKCAKHVILRFHQSEPQLFLLNKKTIYIVKWNILSGKRDGWIEVAKLSILLDQQVIKLRNPRTLFTMHLNMLHMQKKII